MLTWFIGGTREENAFHTLVRPQGYTQCFCKKPWMFCLLCHRASLNWQEVLTSIFLSRCSSIAVSVTDAISSAVFQTMLTTCHRKRPKLCKQLLKRIMEYLMSRNAAPGVRSETTLFLFDHRCVPIAMKCFLNGCSCFCARFQSPPGLSQGPGRQPPHWDHHPAVPQVPAPRPLQEPPQGSPGWLSPPSHRQLPHPEANSSLSQIQSGGS